MTGKKVAFGTKPNNKPTASTTAEEWVKNREDASEEPTKRLTLDIPESLHRAIKVSCAGRGTKMAEEIRVLLEAHYAQR
ncbi:MAG: hypothetical protein WCJ49_04045 [Deltaproteobacteria bacterium]